MVAQLHGPFAWHSETLCDDARWQYDLQPEDIDELESALHHVSENRIPLTRIERDVFPLPRLADKLAAIGDELESGCGMVRLRALPVTRWSRSQLQTVWFGLATHLGKPVYQNARGELLRRICNEGDGVGERYGQLRSSQGTFLSSRARTASSAERRSRSENA